MIKLDMLAFAAHPDDTELSCSGTMLAHIAKGYSVGVVDLTRGEMGTRGTPELRDQEAADAARILGLSVRENLGFADCFFVNDRHHQLEIIKKIRQYQPRIVLANAPKDRHPDHGKAAQLVAEACFLAGLRKIETFDPTNDSPQTAWRPSVVYHYIQDTNLKPDFVVDISNFMETKLAAVMAYKSQFYNPDTTNNDSEPNTYISSKVFLDRIRAKALELGYPLGFLYGEGFISRRHIGVKCLGDLC